MFVYIDVCLCVSAASALHRAGLGHRFSRCPQRTPVPQSPEVWSGCSHPADAGDQRFTSQALPLSMWHLSGCGFLVWLLEYRILPMAFVATLPSLEICTLGSRCAYLLPSSAVGSGLWALWSSPQVTADPQRSLCDLTALHVFTPCLWVVCVKLAAQNELLRLAAICTRACSHVTVMLSRDSPSAEEGCACTRWWKFGWEAVGKGGVDISGTLLFCPAGVEIS